MGDSTTLLARGSTPEHSVQRLNGLPLRPASAITTTMNFRQLKYFEIVAEERHFSRAAARWGIGQSPLSRAMKEFQNDLGIRLLTTTTRNTRLTRAGESFQVEAQRILSSIDHAQRIVKSLVLGEQMSLRIGLFTGCLDSRVSTLVSCLRASVPKANVGIVEIPFSRQVDELESGTIDIGISNAIFESPKIRSDPLQTDQIVVALHASTPLAAKQLMTLSECTLLPLIICESLLASGAQPHIESLLQRAHSGCNIFNDRASVAMLMMRVIAGLGIGFLLQSQTEVLLHPSVVFRPLSCKGSRLTTYILSRREGRSPLVDQFIAAAKAAVP